MILSQIYEKYWIAPNLRRHMCRVAAVGLQITDAWCCKISPDRDVIAQTLLLHDMGKIVHFDFVNSAHLLEEEGGNVEYWRQAQKDFIAKFGNNEHRAMLAIAKEIGVSSTVFCLLDEFGSTSVEHRLRSEDWHLKICTYADFRIGPFGVVSVKERFEELITRFRNMGRTPSEIEGVERDGQYCLELELQIQECMDIAPSAISDESIRPYLTELLHYQI